MGLRTFIRNWLQVEKKNIALPKDWNCIYDISTIIFPEACINNYRGKNSIQIGANTRVRGILHTYPHGGKITIGEYCYIGDHSRIWSSCSIEIGNNVLISHNVNIFDDTTHPIDYIERRKQAKQIFEVGFPQKINSLQPKPIKICNDAWIACNVVILRGVTIGEGVIVGAGSVVTKDVEPWTMVAGNPAKVIRKLKHD